MTDVLFNPDYLIFVLTSATIFVILTMALNMIVGFIGYLNLGHVGFWSIGAYCYSVLLMNGTPFWLALIAGGLLAGFSGFLLGLPTLRLKSHYIAIASLGFTYIVYSLAINLTGITRGPLGIPGIPRPSFWGINFDDKYLFFLLCAAIAVVSGFVMKRVLASPFGKILETIREDEIASQSIGKNTFSFKLKAFTVSAFFAGIAGGLWASLYQFISPYSFFIPELVFLLAALMIGGAGSFWGGVVGTYVLYIIYESVRFMPVPPTSVGALQQMAFALLLIIIMIFRPRGIMGKKAATFHRS